MTDFKDYANLPDSRCEKPSDANFVSGLTEGEPLNSKNENWEKRELAKKFAEVEAEKNLLADEVKKIGKALEGSILETEYRSYATPKDEVVHNTLRAFSVDYLLINTNSKRINAQEFKEKMNRPTTEGVAKNEDKPFIGGYEAGTIQNDTEAKRQMRDYFNAGHGGDFSNSLRDNINLATSGTYQKLYIAPNTAFCMNPLFRGNNFRHLYLTAQNRKTQDRNNYTHFDQWRYGSAYADTFLNKNLIEKFVEECLNNQYARGYDNFICVVPVIKYINENVIDTEIFFNTLDRGDIFTILWDYASSNPYTVFASEYLNAVKPTPTCYVKCSLPLKKKYHGKNCYSAPVVDSQFGEHIKTQALDEMTNMAKDRRYDETDAGLSGRAAFKRAHGNPHLTHVFDTVSIPSQKTYTSIVQQQGIAGTSVVTANAEAYRTRLRSQSYKYSNDVLVGDHIKSASDDNMNSIVDVSFSSHAYITVKV